MTPELRDYVQRIVDAAPAPSAEQIELLRSLLPKVPVGREAVMPNEAR